VEDYTCHECSLPAIDMARIEFDDRVIDVALCADHVVELLAESRPMFPSAASRPSGGA
jgi:hypothetical protein